MAATDAFVTPGEAIRVPGDASLRPGRGVYVQDDVFTAAVVGKVKIGDGLVEVLTSRNNSGETLPTVSALVTGKVLRVTGKLCEVQILCVGDAPTRGAGFKGMLRKENVRAFEVDQVEMMDCFRIGDLITASVVALGSARSYELSTAGNHLGVISAVCGVSREQMVPASWETMRCPLTGIIEKRKVAKPEM